MQELKATNARVKRERKAKGPVYSFADLTLSPKRGKIRPSSAPCVKKNAAPSARMEIKDGYDDRPLFSKAELDRIEKKTLKNAKAKKSGNKQLRETAEFAVKLQVR